MFGAFASGTPALIASEFELWTDTRSVQHRTVPSTGLSRNIARSNRLRPPTTSRNPLRTDSRQQPVQRHRLGLDRPQTWWFILVALTIAVALQTFRVLFPEMYGFADRHGTQTAAAAALLLFASAFATPAVRKLTGANGRTAALLLLALWRIAASTVSGLPFGVTVAAAVAALLAVTMVLTSPSPLPPMAAAQAVLLGVALDAATRCLFATWDPVWQHSWTAVAVAVLTGGSLGLAAWRCRHASGAYTAIGSGGAGVAFSAVMALESLFLASPAFVASSAAISLPWGAFVVLVGLSVGLVVMPLTVRWGTLIPTGFAIVLVAFSFLLPRATGASAIVLVLGGQVAAAVLIAVAATRVGTSRVRAELGLAGGWLLFVLTVLLYQVHFDQPLPFDNRWIVTFGAAVALFALGRRPARDQTAYGRTNGYLPAVATFAAGVMIATGLAATGRSTTNRGAPGGPLRVVEWNIRQAVSQDGKLDPEAIASMLRHDAAPDVVVLPETARGWPLSGDLDLASWLSRRLGLAYRWAPAADQQFGTLLLTRLPVLSAEVIRLPAAGRSQGRSMLKATLDSGDGTPVTVLATHLQARNDTASIDARRKEIDVVLRQWAGSPRTIVIGDLNPRQGDPPLPARRPGEFPEIRAFLDAGFTTAQELTGCSHPTSGRNCSDFVLVSPDMTVQSHVVSDNTFDHRPLVSSVTPEG